MAVNPVLINDLRRSLFRRKPVHAVALVALAILVLTLGVDGVLPGTSFFMSDRLPLWRFIDLLLPVVTPAFASGAFAKEYEQRTWQDILLTRLTAREILRGKFFACLLPTMVTIIVMFPPFAMLMILQNIQWAQEPGLWILVVLLKFVVSATFYVSLVLVCSYHSSNARASLVLGYVILAVYGLLNYALWQFMLAPQFFRVSFPGTTTYVNGNTHYRFVYSGSNYYSPLAASRTQFDLSPVEWLHLGQSAVLSILLLAYLRYRLHNSRNS